MTYGLLDQPLLVTDPVTLEEMASLLHDETCAVDEVVWNQDEGTLLLPVRRQFHGGEEVVIHTDGDAVTYEKDWMRSEVLIRHVLSWEKLDDQGIGDYSFNEWGLEDGTLTIVFCEALVLTIRLDRLEIAMTDLGFSGRARIERSAGGGSESSSGRIY
jgi:hypothetical protein